MRGTMRQILMIVATMMPIAAPAPARAQTPTLSQNTRRFVSVGAPIVALTGVRLVDGNGTAPADNQTIVIEKGRIAVIGRTGTVRVPPRAQVLDLAGHTVFPGLVGLHNHTFYTTNARSIQLNTSAPRLYLASGVTTIRTTGSYSPYSEINLKREIDEGEVPGPRMFITGPYLTGETGVGGMHQVLTPAVARRVVNYWAEEGASWLKFYTTVSRASLKAAIDEAHKQGLKVTGHLCSVGFREAVSLGIDNLEHGLFVNTEYDPEKQPDVCPGGSLPKLAELDLASDAVRTTFRDMIQHQVAMTSTLAVYELYVPNRPPLEERNLNAMSPEVRSEYLASRARLAQPGSFGISPVVFRKAQEYDVAFVRAGGLLGAGVDPTGNGGALPGFGDQRNYELLIEAGFTPVEVVRIMSANGARILGIDDRLGTLAVGKTADLVVIKGDPIERPAEIRNVVTVFKDGVGYDSAKLIESVQGMVGVR